MVLAFAGVSLGGFLAVSSALAASAPAELQAFTPEGVVKQVRQVRATFSEDMVPFGAVGDPVVPFDVSCREKGTARWADTRNWVYDFERDLPGGVECGFQLRSGLHAVSGHELQAAPVKKFSTGGPSIRESRPWQGSEVEEDQAFALILDSPVDEVSVAKGAYFSIEGISEKIGIKILQGKERETVLKAARVKSEHGRDARPGESFIVLQATRRFPSGAKIDLVWGKDIRSPDGVVNAQDQTYHFSSRSAFSARMSCERENKQEACIPFAPIFVNFSAEVPWKLASQIRLKNEAGKAWLPKAADTPPETVGSVRFEGPFPEKAGLRIELPPGLADESGRPLSNASEFPLSTRTSDYPPLAKFAAPFGILEHLSGTALPVTIRNLGPKVQEKLDLNVMRLDHPAIPDLVRALGRLERHSSDYRRRNVSALAGFKPASSEEAHPSLPIPEGAQAFQVIGIPLKSPGFYLVEIESQVLGSRLLDEQKPMYVSSGALVTNLSVHLKKGRESSMAWVTSLDRGEPVEGALVTLTDCQGKVLARKSTDAQGVVKLPALNRDAPRCKAEGTEYQYKQGWFVSAEKGDDFSFVHSSWQKGIEPWRFNLPMDWEGNPRLTHTVLDRSLLRAGETVHMKHYVRRHTQAGVEMLTSESLPKKGEIRHEGSEQKYEIPLNWRVGGIAEGDWAIPKSAKLGRYSIVIPGLGESGQFRVEEFRVPLMKGRIRPPAEKLVAPEKIPLELSVEYLAGGGAGNLPVELKYQVQSRAFRSVEGFEDFVFANGPVKAPSPTEPASASADPENEPEMGEAEDGGADPEAGASTPQKLEKKTLTLDRAGGAHAELDRLPKGLEHLAQVNAELEFRDPNGQIQTATSVIPLYPSSHLVGVKLEGWFASKDSLRFQVAVTDLEGKPAPGYPVDIQLLERKVYSHRKKLIGGFYAYENQVELKRLGSVCSGKVDEHGLLLCDGKAPATGNLILEARTRDASGRESVANQSVWVYESLNSWFAQDDHDRIDVLPEKKRYEPGEKAKLQVRMPFQEATAWVTVEREGILESFVTHLSSKKPLIELPISGAYAPNIYVSIFVVRGRVGEPQPTALADLGKPAYKLGITELKVGWRAHELKVAVTPTKESYRVREKARVKIHVAPAGGGSLGSGGEVALAVVDEGLLLLKPNESWKLLDAMMTQRPYEVETSTAQMEVVGKRHFGLKALPQGGDGGKAPTREIFESLLYWKANVPLDANGNAEAEFPLNDSISSFRVVAIASQGAALFGTGESTIRSTQDLMIFSGVPPVAREGDHFPAQFTLRNATRAPMQLEVLARTSTSSAPLPKQSLTLAPAEAKIIAWDFTVPAGQTSISYEVEANRKGSSQVLDRMKVTQSIKETVPVQVYQATLAQVSKPFRVEVERPSASLPGRGGVQVDFQPTLLTGIDGVTSYMHDYPYNCLEQQVSRAVAMRDLSRFTRAMEELPAYLDGDGLPKYFPSLREGSDVLGSYLLSISSEAGWNIPESSRNKMVAALKRFASGALARPGSTPAADLDLRKIRAISAISRYGAASADLLSPIQINPNLWPTSAVIDWIHILDALAAIPEREAKLKQAEQILRARIHYSGTALSFSTEKTDALSWLMISPDENANLAILTVLGKPEWQADLPKLMRGSLLRQVKGHWLTTPANAWGRLATEKFASRFEPARPIGVSSAKVGLLSKQMSWVEDPKGKMLSFEWPPSRKSLEVEHFGQGAPWAFVQSRAAIPLTSPLSVGYRITKRAEGNWVRGEIIKVHLDIEAQADMSWVVLTDPIPAGATILGGGLGGESKLGVGSEKRRGDVWPAYTERSFDSFREYYEFVPKGKWSIDYRLRLNQSGKLGLPSTRVEAMYAPEMFGEIPNPGVEIRESGK